MNMTMNETELKISGVCDDIKELLIHKNRKYEKTNFWKW